MPASAIIGGVGSVAGGVASGKGASKAASIQAAAQDRQTQALTNMYNENVSLMKPTYDNGTAAQSRINTLLGLGNGDGANVSALLAQTPGYAYQLSQGLASTNANAYAAGLGDSGAALKTLQDRGNGMAQSNFQTYLGNVNGVADRGVQAMGGIVGQGNTTTNAQNAVTQAGANAASANSVYQGNNLSNVLKGLTNSAGQAFGSSYTSPASTNAFATPSNGYAMNLTPSGFSTGAWNSIVGGS